jgi:predicted nuclease of restriction endonuclease-like (RecB) superfamily
MSDKPAPLTPPPAGYADLLPEMKSRIHSAQQRATLAVNRELVLLYWQIGRDILSRQAEQEWGAKVIERLAHDLRNAFPDMKGFSPRNLNYMRAFAEAWPDAQFVHEVLAQLPWYHQLALLDKLKTPDERRGYAQKAIENNWSRNVLVMQIETRLLERQSKAVTNFKQRLPKPQFDLARELLKDPYRFDFLGMTDPTKSSPPWCSTSHNSCWSWARALPLSAVRYCSMSAATSSSSTCSFITSSCVAIW